MAAWNPQTAALENWMTRYIRTARWSLRTAHSKINFVDKYDFPPLSYISVLEKKTDLRVLILFWFSFPGLQVRIPASRPWLLYVWCASWSAVAGKSTQEPPSQRLATLLTPPTGHHPSPGYRCHLQCSCTTEGPCLLAGMLEHTSGKL